MPIHSDNLIAPSDEDLYRQVHPSFIRDGRPTRQAFRPNSGDNGEFSVDRGTLTSARAAYEAYLSRGNSTAGSWCVKVAEFHGLTLSAYSDPIADSPSHALVDYTSHTSTSQLERISKKVQLFALSYGCLHPKAA